ncbi:MAG: hypothetical protein JNK14_17830 [Chitinophagaceae bacterium]|nr:hypothetical protein [Chitinophagaceae bacterium]
MNTTHLHLLLNHFPIIGTLIGSGLLVWGVTRKQNTIKMAAALILAVMAIVAIPVYLTGEPAEESVENLPGISESLIELHEEAAVIAIWLMSITGLASLVALLFAWQKRKATGTVFILVLVLSVFAFGTMARTGYYGGQIRHTEIRDGKAAQLNSQQGDQKENNGGEKDDEDD